MQERIAVLQGHFQLESHPGKGCCIFVEIPIQISHLPDILKVSLIQESSSVNQLQPVQIGDWQPLTLDEW
ncbi:hypothetical protein [Fischerella thermalis]|uniref:hypothetical protein n=1 Tax=Fischerella thermalis TaxID=372787 RepID=UPI000C80DCD4|nr:hypothetical protein [Fischerella thermalis]MBF1990817.1 hypothetical protein [Fischerella thermalis M58_A2018_009]MBF2061289.1 hypothetical protein [Fischerella thermalis M66_A2018_004]PLZ91806.1 hypothetical protein CI593_06020 [Fischerella thermalis CCMEE 5194]